MVKYIYTKKTKGNDMIGEHFSITDFLKESVEQTEWDAIHFSDGSKRYQYRTEEDRLNNCRKPYGVGLSENGLLYIKREYPCRIYSGENVCQDCIKARERIRKRDFSDRLDSVDDGVCLYAITTNTVVEQKRMGQNCKYHGYDFISVPTGNIYERYSVVNGPVKGSEPVSIFVAKKKLSSLSSIMFIDRSQRVSGKLGLSDEIISDNRDGDDIIILCARDIIYGKKKPGAIDVGIANAKIAKRLSLSENGNAIEITPDNAQHLLSTREDESLRVLRSMGFDCSLSSKKERKFNLSSMMTQWISISSAKYEVTGNTNGIDELTKRIINLTVQESNKYVSAGSFDDAIDKVISSSFYQ